MGLGGWGGVGEGVGWALGALGGPGGPWGALGGPWGALGGPWGALALALALALWPY